MKEGDAEAQRKIRQNRLRARLGTLPNRTEITFEALKRQLRPSTRLGYPNLEKLRRRGKPKP